MTDRLLRYVTGDAPFRCVVVWMPATGQTLVDQHRPTDAMSEALGSFAVASLLLASNLKGRGTASLSLQSTGAIGIMNADGTPDGLVRAMIVQGDLKGAAESARLNLPVIGPGTLTVVRRIIDEPQPYTGVVEIGSPHIGPIIANYLLVSEQVQSSVATATLVAGGQVSACAGFLVEALPGMSEKELSRMEANITALGNFKEFLKKVRRPEEIAEILMAGFSPQLLKEIPVQFYCPCSEERVIRAILSVGRVEAEKLAKEKESLEVFCDYCRKRYVVEPASIGRALLNL